MEYLSSIGTFIGVVIITAFIIRFIINKKKTIKDEDIYEFFENLSFSLSSGGSIQSALNFYLEQNKNKKMMPIVETVYKDISSGLTFAEALKKQPVFSNLFCEMVSVGQSSSRLPEILEEINLYLEQKMDIKRMPSSNMTGYIFIGCMVLVLLVVSFFLIHMFKDIFAQLNMSLPLVSRISLNICEFVIKHWLILIFLITGLFLVVKTYIKNNTGLLDLYKFKIPVFGPIYKNFITYNITKIYYLLLENGIESVTALTLVSTIVDNIYIKQMIKDALMEIGRGKTIIYALEDENEKMHLLDRSMFFLLKSGEENNSTAASFLKTSERYRKTLLMQLKTIETKIKWPMNVVLVLFLLWIYISIMQPIFSMAVGTTNQML